MYFQYFALPVATPAPTGALVLNSPVSPIGWRAGLDTIPHVPTLPVACTALLALVFALTLAAIFLAIGWRRGIALAADEEKGEIAMEQSEAEKRSVVVSNTEIFS
jgi:hypothetical protein